LIIPPLNLELFEHPTTNSMCRMKYSNYSKLDNNGLCAPGTRMFGDNMLIGKPMLTNTMMNTPCRYTKRNCSMSMKANENGIVDNVLISMTKEGYCLPQRETRVFFLMSLILLIPGGVE
jgi:DNA-directed RNA polymerase II subunit RPB2